MNYTIRKLWGISVLPFINMGRFPNGLYTIMIGWIKWSFTVEFGGK